MREQKASGIFGEEWESGICNGARWGDRSSWGAAISRRRRTWGERTDATRTKLTAAKEIKTYCRWRHSRRHCRRDNYYSRDEHSEFANINSKYLVYHRKQSVREKRQVNKTKNGDGRNGGEIKIKICYRQTQNRIWLYFLRRHGSYIFILQCVTANLDLKTWKEYWSTKEYVGYWLMH